MTDTALEALLFVRGGPAAGVRRKPEPDWAGLHRELRRPGVTLMLLWQEYRAGAPDGYGYSRFCELYEAWESRLSPTMRQVHPAGERLFVDYAGQTVELVDGRTGEVRAAQVFVAVLGASSYTYAEASWTQTLPDWIGAHVRALDVLRRRAAPDRARQPQGRRAQRPTGTSPGSIRPTRTSPPTTARRSCRRGRASRATRPRSRSACRWSSAGSWPACATSASSRSERAERARSRELLDELNDRPMRRLGVSRRQLFDELDRPALAALPGEPYVYAEWRQRRVALDYHVDVDGHYYSVPHRLLREQVEARITERTVELFHKGERVACHLLRRRARPPHHRARAHAELASPPRRLDPRAHPARGRRHRARHRQPGRRDPAQPASSRAGLSRLPGHPAARPPVRRRPPRGRLPARPRDRRPILRLDQLDPQQQPRSPAAAARIRGAELPLDHPNIRGSRYYH